MQFVIAFLIIITLILRPEGIFDRWEIDDLVRRFLPAARRSRASSTDAPGALGDAGAAVEPIDASAPPVLHGDQVAKHFEGVTALAGVDIEVRAGEILGLIGPNGSGKTTLLNVISGVYVPTEGHVIFDGQEIGGRKPHQVAALGLSRTFQNIRLFAQLTVRENVEAATPPGTAESAVDEMLAWFGLTGVAAREGRQPPRTACSAGWRSPGPWCADPR